MGTLFELGLDLPPAGSREIRRALYDQLKAAILDGRLATGSQLPPSRKLSQSLGVSRNTVVVVYDMLTSEGYLTSRIGAGAFVAPVASAPRNAAEPSACRPAIPAAIAGPVADFRLGSPDTTGFPFAVW